MLDAQLHADKTNSGITVHFRNSTTFVEPNLPRFTRVELMSRLAALTPKSQVVLTSDDDDEEEDEIDELSQSILCSRRTIKETKVMHY